MSTASQQYRVAIIGTGFSGLGMAIRLKQSGIQDFVILERSDGIGGTWHDNTYPGCACDVQSHLYSFSFALNPDWTRLYSAQPEIWAYLRHCAEHYGIVPHIRWQCPMEAASWNEAAQQWHITTPQGLITAQVLILGNGPLSEPNLPNIPGLPDFQGKLFHSAQWEHNHDLTGERVAVIGTGASAIQFVPQIQPKVSQLKLFLRTPPWIFPRMDHDIPTWQRKLFRWLPLAQRLIRAKMYLLREYGAIGLVYKPERVKIGEKLALQYLASQIADPDLRAKLTPNYTLGCKRILLSDDFYTAVTKPNVDVVTDGIKEIRAHSVVTVDDTEHPVDTIICGTGFHATDAPMALLVRGRDDKLLAETWHGNNAQAYLGTTVAGYPNMFLIIGPNTGLGHNSMVYMIESQIAYILDALHTMQRQQIQTVEVRPETQADYNTTIQNRLQGTVWNSGCKSWYMNTEGRNTTLWPGFTFNFRRLTRHFDPIDYSLNAKTDAKVAVPTA